ncbi:hypothetical protein HO173_003682 [Letharia columbiana]|uniref:Uncharacterized protein n=1 Tax=Letharia columbiana TaxID=112416 RepID=A0A8H6L785_9LECA|nr:uncharacterized protein HO173_003682 [Letharia columbiana]KAF6238048.1 hypothetical protein HO173_003682 [Letharia columbiana]
MTNERAKSAAGTTTDFVVIEAPNIIVAADLDNLSRDVEPSVHFYTVLKKDG